MHVLVGLRQVPQMCPIGPGMLKSQERLMESPQICPDVEEKI